MHQPGKEKVIDKDNEKEKNIATEGFNEILLLHYAQWQSESGNLFAERNHLAYTTKIADLFGVERPALLQSI